MKNEEQRAKNEACTAKHMRLLLCVRLTERGNKLLHLGHFAFDGL